MYNILLEGRFPESYKGYPLNTDFRVGIKLTLLSEDTAFPEDLRLLKAFDLLYKAKVPDIETAYAGLVWFLSTGKSEVYYADIEPEKPDTERCIDFEYDATDIWAAFMSRGIDLRKENMHWFAFMSLIPYLGDCPLTQRMSYRATDLNELKGSTREYYAKLKNRYRIRKPLTREEYDLAMKEAEDTLGSYYMKLKRGDFK